MKVIYAQEELPRKRKLKIGHSVFLAGPTPRDHTPAPSWRPEMIQRLEKLSPAYVNEILVPEPRNKEWTRNYLAQVDWEEDAIEYCDILVFWIPRDIENGMPGFTTNVEFGWWLDKKDKLVLGYPRGADKCRYLGYKFKKLYPEKTIAASMAEVVQQVTDICQR